MRFFQYTSRVIFSNMGILDPDTIRERLLPLQTLCKMTERRESHMPKKASHAWFWAIDKLLLKASRILSFFSVAALLVMAFLSTIDVICSKFFGTAIPIQSDLIKYLLVVTVFCFLPDIQLERGLMVVDILSAHYSPAIKRLVSTIGNALGIMIFSTLFVKGFTLLARMIREKTMSALSASAFPIWPFALAYVVGCFMLSLAFLWTIVRTYTRLETESPLEESEVA